MAIPSEMFVWSPLKGLEPKSVLNVIQGGRKTQEIEVPNGVFSRNLRLNMGSIGRDTNLTAVHFSDGSSIKYVCPGVVCACVI